MAQLSKYGLSSSAFWSALARPRTFLPQEHGSFVLFVAPLVVGVLVSGLRGPRLFAYAIAALALFLVRQPLDLLLRSLRRKRTRSDVPALLAWAAFYGAAILLAGGYLLVVNRLWGLLWIGVLGIAMLALQLWTSSARLARTSWSEVIGTAGLGLGAAGAWYVATGAWARIAFVLWILVALQGAGGILYSRWRLHRRQSALRAATSAKEAAANPRAPVLVHHVFALALVLVLAVLGYVPWVIAPLYAGLFARVTVGTRPAAMPDRTIIRIGISEGVATLVAAAWIVLAFR